MTRGELEEKCYIFIGGHVVVRVVLVFVWLFRLDCPIPCQSTKNGAALESVYPTSSCLRVIKIAAGELHSVALTEYGKVFMWGNKEFMVPEWMSALDGVNIVDVGAGERYSTCLSDKGELYTFGRGSRFLMSQL